jgi:hypothetical protein
MTGADFADRNSSGVLEQSFSDAGIDAERATDLRRSFLICARC